MPEVNDAPVDEEFVEDEILEDDEVEDEDEDDESTGKKRTRKTLSSDNKYIFDYDPSGNVSLLDAAKAAKEGLSSLVYEDGESVEGFRVWQIAKKEGENLKVVAHVLSRNKDQAACTFLETKHNYEIDMCFKQKRGGRGPTKIQQTMLDFGAMLADVVLTDDGVINVAAPEAQVKMWTEYFGPAGKYAHYRDENGNWKEANTD